MSIYLYNDRNSARWIGWNEPKFATCLQVFFRLCYGIFERMCLLRPDAYQEDDDYMLRSLICQIVFGYSSWQEPDIEANLFSQVNTEGLENVYNRYDTELNKLCKSFCKSDHTCYSDINDVLDELGYDPLEIEENGDVYSDADIKTFGRMFDLNWAKKRADVLDKLRIAFIPFKEDVIDYEPSTDYAPHQFFLKSKKCYSLSTLPINGYFSDNHLGNVYALARDNLIEYEEKNLYIYKTSNMPTASVDGFDLAYNEWEDKFYYNDDTEWGEIGNASIRSYIANKMMNGLESGSHQQNIRLKTWTERGLFDLDYYSNYITELDAYGAGLPKNPCYGRAEASEEEIESWGRRYNPATGEMDGDWKNAGWRGIIEIGEDLVMTEVGLSDEFDGVEIGYPLIVPTTTDEELLLIAQAQVEGDDSVIPQSAYTKAVAWAISRLNQDKDPFYNGDEEDEELRNIDSTKYTEEYNYFLDTTAHLVYTFSSGEYVVYHGYEHTVFHYNQGGEEFYGMYKYIDPSSNSHNTYYQDIQNSNLPILYLNQDKKFSNGTFSNYSNPKYTTFRVQGGTWHDSYIEVLLYPPSDPTYLEDPNTMRLYAMPNYIYGTDNNDDETSYPIHGFGATLPAKPIDGYFFRTTDKYIYEYDDSTNQWVKNEYVYFKTVTSIEYIYYTIERGSLSNSSSLSDITNGVYHPYTVLMQRDRGYGDKLHCEFTLTKELAVNTILPAIRYNLGEEKIFLKATVVPVGITVNSVGESTPSGTASIGTRYYQNALKTETQQGDDYNYCSIYEYKSSGWSEVFRVTSRDANTRNYQVYMYEAWGNHICTTSNSNYRYYLEMSSYANSSKEYLFEYSIYNDAFPMTTDTFGFTYENEEGSDTSLVIANTDNPREIEMLGDYFISISTDSVSGFQNAMQPNPAYMNTNSYQTGYPKYSERYFGQSSSGQYTWSYTDLLTGFQLVAKALIVDTGDYFMATKKYG